VAELMQGHDPEECDVLDSIPDHRRVGAAPGIHLDQSDEKPGPVQKHLDPRETKQANGALTAQHELLGEIVIEQ
jgi:hypothetical protein